LVGVIAAVGAVGIVDPHRENSGLGNRGRGRAEERRMSSPASAQRTQSRLALVEAHIGHENRHDLEAVMSTFGSGAQFDDEPWSDHRTGLDGVRSYYTELLRAVPDLVIDVAQYHVAGDSIVAEVTIGGTHLGPWRGLPATGRRVHVPLCGVYTFDSADRLAGERIYYDRALVLHQLGFFHEPVGLGRFVTALSHPVSLARALLRLLRRRSPVK
jgi:steroid delta-isomerase-like uncharacterized protein